MACRLEIEMPDRPSAFQLEDELRRFYPLAVGRHGVWHVEVDAEDGDLAEVVLTAQDWVRAHDGDTVILRLS